MEDKNTELNNLDEVTGGIMPPLPDFKCKECGKSIAMGVYSKNNGYCDACKPKGGNEGGW